MADKRGQLAPPCPKCGSTTSLVTDSRYYLPQDTKRRRRVCGKCGTRFFTEERTLRIITISSRTMRTSTS